MKTATLSYALTGLSENFGGYLGFSLDANGFGAAMGGNDPGQFQCVHSIIFLENSVVQRRIGVTIVKRTGRCSDRTTTRLDTLLGRLFTGGF